MPPHAGGPQVETQDLPAVEPVAASRDAKSPSTEDSPDSSIGDFENIVKPDEEEEFEDAEDASTLTDEDLLARAEKQKQAEYTASYEQCVAANGVEHAPPKEADSISIMIEAFGLTKSKQMETYTEATDAATQISIKDDHVSQDDALNLKHKAVTELVQDEVDTIRNAPKDTEPCKPTVGTPAGDPSMELGESARMDKGKIVDNYVTQGFEQIANTSGSTRVKESTKKGAICLDNAFSALHSDKVTISDNRLEELQIQKKEIEVNGERISKFEDDDNLPDAMKLKKTDKEESAALTKDLLAVREVGKANIQHDEGLLNGKLQELLHDGRNSLTAMLEELEQEKNKFDSGLSTMETTRLGLVEDKKQTANQRKTNDDNHDKFMASVAQRTTAIRTAVNGLDNCLLATLNLLREKTGRINAYKRELALHDKKVITLNHLLTFVTNQIATSDEGRAVIVANMQACQEALSIMDTVELWCIDVLNHRLNADADISEPISSKKYFHEINRIIVQVNNISLPRLYNPVQSAKAGVKLAIKKHDDLKRTSRNYYTLCEEAEVLKLAPIIKEAEKAIDTAKTKLDDEKAKFQAAAAEVKYTEVRNELLAAGETDETLGPDVLVELENLPEPDINRFGVLALTS